MNIFTYWWSFPYVRWHIIFTFLPTILLWGFCWKYFLRYKKTFLFVTIGSILWGALFDMLATPVFHIYFYPGKNLGITWMGIPLEELLFLLFIPQAVTGIILLLRNAIYGKA